MVSKNQERFQENSWERFFYFRRAFGAASGTKSGDKGYEQEVKMDKRVRIPDTDLSMSAIGLGTSGAGVKWDGPEVDRLIGAYLDMGGNVIDTARVYSDWIPPETGRSERVLGDWLRRSGKRNSVIIMTKGGHPKYTSPSDDLHISRCAPEDMRGDVEKSLKALGVDTIDLYFFHRDDPRIPVKEMIDVMEEFRREGKIRYYGCSNWTAERMAEADSYAQEKGYRGFAADQALLNLGMKYMNPLEDDTLVYMKDSVADYHRKNHRNLAVPYMGVANGFFHKYIKKGPEAIKGDPYCTEGNLKTAERVRELMEKYDATVTQVVLGFFRYTDFPCVPLYGAKNAEQIQEAMKTMEIPFRAEDYKI